ncbi:alpha/beta fold hydrolase [Alkalicoccus chagannorensis]|uniref:alpha/beta fold hydrolase n=1 Tax=Alkalicoccus chagannorensis TaxID=427072 RepID=UPI000478A662|nr:alpha/beta hydrolase [Alkalicoccus chagannorensis]
MPYLQHQGASLYYEEHGTGNEVMLFTHGASLDHRMWKTQVQHFSKRHRVITWDVRGHGLSSLPKGPVDPDVFYQDLLRLIEETEADQVTLCGLSMGGHMALQAAAAAPEKVKGLVLMGTPFTYSLHWHEKLAAPLNRWTMYSLPMAVTTKLQGHILSKHRPANKDYILAASGRMKKNSWSRIWGAVTKMDSSNDLPLIEAPALLIIGEDDWLVRQQQEHMEEQMQRAESVIIPRAHHAVNLDNPKAVNERIDLFLQHMEAGIQK